MPKSVFKAFSRCLYSDAPVGWRAGGTFSRSRRRLEEDAGLSEGESVQGHKSQSSFTFPPVIVGTTNKHKVSNSLYQRGAVVTVCEGAAVSQQEFGGDDAGVTLDCRRARSNKKQAGRPC